MKMNMFGWWKDITAAVLIIGMEIVIRLPENSELSCNLQQFCCACQCFHSTMSRKKDTIALLKRKGVFFCLHCSRTRNAEQNLKGIRIWLVVCPITSGLYGQQCRAEIRTLAQALHLIAIFLLHRLFRLWRLACRKLNHGFCFFNVQRSFFYGFIPGGVIIVAVGEICNLLNLCQKKAGSKGVHRSGRNQEYISLFHRDFLKIGQNRILF